MVSTVPFLEAALHSVLFVVGWLDGFGAGDGFLKILEASKM